MIPPAQGKAPVTECVVYRCSRQPDMYLYLRAGLAADDLPADLRQRAGRLTQVMTLSLHPGRSLARVDVSKVLRRLAEAGYYLQLPPRGAVHGHLDDGD